ncbi:MAG: replicative DNA helicase [Gammaproteobacteria bacterium]|nr:replicative DNA helicase [Gammaproteobacteria bacterium]
MVKQDLNDLKIPPHSIEAEQSVLGGLMIDNIVWDDVIDRIQEADFYRHEHRLIFRAMHAISARNEPVDHVTLLTDLEQRGELKAIGNEAYLMELANNTPSALNIVAYADIVRERSILRQLIHIANTIASNAFKPNGQGITELLDAAEQKIFNIANQNSRGAGPVDINVVMAKAVEKIEELRRTKGNLTGLSSGFSDLDHRTSGLQNSDLIIVAGRPSMGKTTFAMNIAENAALELAKKKDKRAVLVFSMEMPAESLAIRMLSSLGHVKQQSIRTGRLSDEDWRRIPSIFAQFSETHLLIDDTAALSPAEIRARSRRVAKQYGGVALIVVDYLQLMQVPGSSENRTNEVSEISRGLKALAKELNTPLIALSQLNRALEQRADRRPVMSDIRESGSIEQDADLILFLYREEVYDKESTKKNIAELIIGKHRNGPIGTLELRFDGSISRFDNLEQHYGDVPQPMAAHTPF